MPGRPRLPGTDAQRAAARRRQVRENVRAFRQRNRERTLSDQTESSETTRDSSRQSSVATSEPGSSAQAVTQLEDSVRQLRLSSTRNGISIRWSLELPFRIDIGPAYANTFIKAFRDQSMPSSANQEPLALVLTSPAIVTEGDDASTQITPSMGTNLPISTSAITPPNYIRVEVCCWKWTTTVTFEAASEGSEMLREALLAAALSLVSIPKHDSDMEVQAIHIQTQAIRRLREGFDDYARNNDKEKAALLSATAMAISMSELLINKSWDGFSLHLQGIGALIQNAGPATLESELARNHLQGYRTVQLPFSILNRKSTFLARAEWTNHPWRDQNPAADNGIHSLLDIAFRLPCLMEIYDKTIGRNSNASRRILKKLDKIASSLNNWNSDFIEEYDSAIYETHPAFWGGLHAEVLRFQDDMAAHCFTSYTGVRIVLFSLVCQLADDLKDVDETSRPILSGAIEESFKWARTSCQCIEYFFASGQMVAGKLSCLLAFECAWSTFVVLKENHQMDMERELLWCKSTADRISATGLPVFKMR